jgi:hypothetical protein
MLGPKICASVAFVAALAAAPVLAQQNPHEQHPPGRVAPPAATPPGTMPQEMPGGATAEPGAMPMMGMMHMMMGREGMTGMAMMATAMTEHVEGRLAFLKTELKITDQQLPQWNNFAQAVRDNAKVMKDMMQGGMMGTSQIATLPERLALREKMLSAHLEALKKLESAVDPLYAAFTDEQKKAADQLMLSPMGMM